MLSKTAATLIDVTFTHPGEKHWHGDDPRLDFSEDVFTGDNWNDARLILLRQLFDELVVNVGIEVAWGDQNAHIFRAGVEDQQYVFIRVMDGPAYDIEWYKNRGTTDVVRKDGLPVSLTQFRELVEQLAEVFPKALFVE